MIELMGLGAGPKVGRGIEPKELGCHIEPTWMGHDIEPIRNMTWHRANSPVWRVKWSIHIFAHTDS